ncbi:MAG: polysaccharide biosynthesis C-terminal domain-containing protein, partial [Lachnospiraceae bacterium]|nr:polysaccharide biosynthesis C-terminal domain-containing protein [Lachnospiraceae bacterium]
YMPCIILLRVMCPTIPFIAWANVIRTQYLIPNQEDKSYIISVIIGAVVNLAINILLIPQMGAMGAVVGTVCAEGSVCICQTMMVRKKLDIVQYLKKTVMYFFIGGIMLFTIMSVRNVSNHEIVVLALEIIIGGAVYVVLSGMYFAWSHRLSVSSIVSSIIKKKR